jgi:hypothetical protein
MSNVTQPRFAWLARNRGWISLTNSTVLSVLLFVGFRGAPGVLGVLAWVMLGMSVLSGLCLVGVLAARGK